MKSNRSIVKPLGFCQINDTRKLVQLVYKNVFQIDIGNYSIILKFDYKERLVLAYNQQIMFI